MADDDKYASDFGGVWEKRSGSYTGDTSKEDTKAKTPTYRYAQKEAMKKGDAGTYFMRKSSTKSSSKRGSK